MPTVPTDQLFPKAVWLTGNLNANIVNNKYFFSILLVKLFIPHVSGPSRGNHASNRGRQHIRYSCKPQRLEEGAALRDKAALLYIWQKTGELIQGQMLWNKVSSNSATLLFIGALKLHSPTPLHGSFLLPSCLLNVPLPCLILQLP